MDCVRKRVLHAALGNKMQALDRAKRRAKQKPVKIYSKEEIFKFAQGYFKEEPNK
jgi:hypothetical protein